MRRKDWYTLLPKKYYINALSDYSTWYYFKGLVLILFFKVSKKWVSSSSFLFSTNDSIKGLLDKFCRVMAGEHMIPNGNKFLLNKYCKE